MHSGFQIPESEQQHSLQQHQMASNPDQNGCTSLLLSMNQAHNVLEQIHGTQQLFLDQPLFLPPHHNRLGHHIYGRAPPPPSSSFFPVNFKLGLNEVCKISNKDCMTHVGCVDSNEEEEGLFRGSEQFLGMHHCWQNQEDSAIKQNQQHQALREPEESNEKSNDTVFDTSRENTKMKQAPASCLDTKSRALFGELEAIYGNQTGPSSNGDIQPVIDCTDHGYSEANSIGGDDQLEARTVAANDDKRRRRRRKKKRDYEGLISPMAEFFEGLLKQMVSHQVDLHKKFGEVMERIDQERLERDEAWRERERARFELEAEERACDKVAVESREAAIVSYLERITGRRVDFRGRHKGPESRRMDK